MRSRIAFVIAVLYLPAALSITRVGFQRVVPIMALTILPLLVAAFLMKEKNANLVKATSPLRSFNLFYIALVVLHLILLMSTVRLAAQWILGNILSIALISYFSRFDREEVIVLLERTFGVIAAVFLVQLSVSAYESYQGSYLEGGALWDEASGPNIGIEAEELETRIIFRLFTSELGFLSQFTLPFSGLLGQHNYWGTQLPFYNLIFLYLFHVRRKRRWIILAALSLLAAILNTSRFGIIAILVSDVVLFLWETRGRWKFLKLVTVLVLAVPLWKMATAAVHSIDDYSQVFNTLLYRFELYQRSWAYFESRDILNIVFGVGAESIADIARRGIGSFESEFMSKMVLTGIVGLTLFLVFLFRMGFQSARMTNYPQVMGYLITFNIITVSLISNLVFVYSVVGVVTLLYVYNVEMYAAKQQTLAIPGQERESNG